MPARHLSASSASTSTGFGLWGPGCGVAVAGSATTRGVSERPHVGASARGLPTGVDSAAAQLSPQLRGEARDPADRVDPGDAGSHSPSAGSQPLDAGDPPASEIMDSGEAGSHSPSAGSPPLDAGDPAVGGTGTHLPSRSGVAGSPTRLVFAGRAGLHHSDAGLALGVPGPLGDPGLFTHSPSLIAAAGVVWAGLCVPRPPEYG